MKKHICLLLVLLLTAALLCGCQNSGDLLTNVKPNRTAVREPDTPAADRLAVYDFSVQLFQQSIAADNADNTLISPLSVLTALGMITNGAADETLTQMEATFGLSVDELNRYLRAYTAGLPQSKKAGLSIANSIWLKDDLDMQFKTEFLQTCADYYNPGIYQVPFNDQTLKQINSWVKQNTDGMIEQILDNIHEDAVMYLINALTFDAEWETIYFDTQIHQNTFTAANGREQQVDFMHNNEYAYLQDENAQGFIKYYANRDYAFMALLPDEGLSLEDYAASLTGEKLNKLLQDPENVQVRTGIPKFEAEYALEMTPLLQNMGMIDAFDPYLADFSGAAELSADDNLYISQVRHKTYIQVNERGTRAGAATAVTLENGGARPPEDYKEVYLNRPFIYLLIDGQNRLPLFIGAVTSVE